MVRNLIKKNKESIKITHKKWEEKNKDKRRSMVAKERAIRIRATPNWLTKQDLTKSGLFIH